MAKIRADQLLVDSGLCDSRAIAQRLIMAGQVRLNPDNPVRKPGQMLNSDTELLLDGGPRFVSRGAFKLLPALAMFAPPVTGATVLDLGASTGGFSDLMLQHGAAKVYAIDVGYGQLHDKIRRDPRVVVLEHTNARDLTPSLIPDPIDILTADVSFISLTKVLPPCNPLFNRNAWAFILIKPQFEAERHEIASGGVVRDESVRQRCISQIIAFAQTELGWRHAGGFPAPLKGPKGNQEYVAAFSIARETPHPCLNPSLSNP